MDRIKLDQLITDNMKSIFGFALTRLGNVNEADDLASDILYEIIRSAHSLKDDTRFYSFMWKIAENTYVDYLRKKSKQARYSAELDENIADETDFTLEKIIKKEELNLLRRELSLLSKQYRDTTVLYYIENLSCSKIANKLQISTEMVKYYLFRARNMIREGMHMERLYGEKSYRPNGFEIDYWGSCKFNPNEYNDFKKRKIKGNILLSAYYNSVTIQEISMELGVALPYLEDEIKLLIDSQYLICNNGKYLTNIPIFTLDCTNTINTKLKELTTVSAKKFIAVTDEFDKHFGQKFPNTNISRWQKVLMCLHFSLMETEDYLKNVYGKSSDNELGIIWGRSFEASVQNQPPQGIRGIYNGCTAKNRQGSIIAMNFNQILNAQHFEYGLTDAVVCSALDGYEQLSKDWQSRLNELGYLYKDGNSNVTVWSTDEYAQLKNILSESISIISDLSCKTSEIAANITADLAPTHIRKTAGYVGAVVYRFNVMGNLVNTLFEMNWLKEVDNQEKPAICVIKN